MRLDRSDLKRLRGPIAAALILIGIDAASLIVSDNRLVEARKAQKAAQDQLRSTRDRVSRVAEEEREIRDNLVHFEKMASRGMVGAEKRLEWIESIAAIRQRRRLFEIRYTVDAQRVVDYPGIVQARKSDGATFVASKLKLEMQLLHEGDLLDFLADLQSAGNSLVSPRSCSISRVEGSGGGGGPMRPRLRASCVVDMITLKTPDAA